MRGLLLLSVLLFVACGSTRIRSQDPHAEIFMNHQSLGVGEVSIGRVGPPKRAQLEARREGKTVGETELRRSFTGMTVLWGLFSYYTGFYWGWYYPKVVTIPLKSTSENGAPEFKSPWVNPESSIWMQPLR